MFGGGGSMFQGAGSAGSGWKDQGTTVVLVTSTDAVGIGTASPTATGLEVNHATQAEFIITQGAGTDWAAWTCDNNSIITFGDADSSRDFIFQAATGFPFSGTTEVIRFKSTKVTQCAGNINLSAVATTSALFVIPATTNTPTVAFGTTSAGAIAATTTPAGYMQIEVGGAARYIPFWI